MSGRRPFNDALALRVEALSAVRGPRILFADLAFEACAGDFVEVRGANGSGKTTLLRTLAGFARPKRGRVVLEGAEEPSLSVHYVGHQNATKSGTTARSHVAYWRRLLGSTEPGLEALARLGLSAQAHLPVRVLSQGQARRLALARLLLSPRPLWLLDEPAAGLDNQGRLVLATLIAEHQSAGGIVVACVHEPLGVSPSRTVELGG